MHEFQINYSKIGLGFAYNRQAKVDNVYNETPTMFKIITYWILTTILDRLQRSGIDEL